MYKSHYFFFVSFFFFTPFGLIFFISVLLCLKRFDWASQLKEGLIQINTFINHIFLVHDRFWYDLLYLYLLESDLSSKAYHPFLLNLKFCPSFHEIVTVSWPCSCGPILIMFCLTYPIKIMKLLPKFNVLCFLKSYGYHTSSHGR